MDKQFLLSTIDKYYLNGLVERVKWNVKNNVLNVNFIAENKDMMGNIYVKEFDSFNDEEVAIFNTSQLYKLIGITGQLVLLSLKKTNKIATKILIADNQYNLEYSLSDMLLIPPVPKVEEPEYEFEFDIDKELIEKYIKARKAISSTETVTICTKFDSEGHGIVSFTIGETNDHSNKVNFSSLTTKMSIPSSDLIFNVDYIREIFDNNREATTAKGYIADGGIMKLYFYTEKISSTYYLIARE